MTTALWAAAAASRTFDRRKFLSAALASGMLARGATSESLVVKTTKGKLRGMEENGVVVFKGVPYAGPCDGANRFKAPTRQVAVLTTIVPFARLGLVEPVAYLLSHPI